jgi:hypothetical protein
MILPSNMKFKIGRLIISSAALQALSTDEICLAVDHHICGQWGDISDRDRAANELALSTGAPLLSVYRTDTGTEVRVLTTSNRFATMIYLPTDTTPNA